MLQFLGTVLKIQTLIRRSENTNTKHTLKLITVVHHTNYLFIIYYLFKFMR